MKFFPLKIAILCLFLSPVLYVLSLNILEGYFSRQYSDQIRNIIIGDTKSLLDGSVRVEERIASNIDTFLQNDQTISYLKLKLNVRVIAAAGKILYPMFQDLSAFEAGLGQEADRSIVARNNFDLLNNDFSVSVETRLNHGSRTANILLFIYLGVSFSIFFAFYTIASKKAAKERESKSRIISELQKEEASYRHALDYVNREKQDLFENMQVLNIKYQESKEKAKSNEDELFEEIISLEEQLKAFIDLKQNKESEILELKSQVQKFERRKGSKSRRNDFDFYDKRFSALYKNILMNRKAVSGFMTLNDDQQIKAEELIHQLDLDLDKVLIKRKVFVGKKHKATSFEVLFAYNGRLYFRKIPNNRVEVLVIGTKNTQQKDMEFLHNL